MNNHLAPYENLDPNLILEAMESIGFRCSGSLLALNSYENRVYQIGIEDELPIIAKFYRPYRWSDAAIKEEHQFALELAACEIPVVAPLEISPHQTLHTYQNFRFAVFPRQGGRTIELDNYDHLEWIGRFLGRLHAVGATKTFQYRLELNAQTYGINPYKFLIDNNFIPIAIKENFCKVFETLLHHIELNFRLAGKVNFIRIHGDCHIGNLLWNHSGPQILDLDDCLIGPAIQDIWMLLTGDNDAEINSQLSCLLEGYQEFFDFNYRELYLIEALRALRMIHYAGWLAKRWEDPAFPLNFPWFNTPNYWQELTQDLREQSLLLEQKNAQIKSLNNY